MMREKTIGSVRHENSKEHVSNQLLTFLTQICSTTYSSWPLMTDSRLPLQTYLMQRLERCWTLAQVVVYGPLTLAKSTQMLRFDTQLHVTQPQTLSNSDFRCEALISPLFSRNCTCSFSSIWHPIQYTDDQVQRTTQRQVRDRRHWTTLDVFSLIWLHSQSHDELIPQGLERIYQNLLWVSYTSHPQRY